MSDTKFKRSLATGDQNLVGTLPNFLIVGAMKSGTTSLAWYLGRHPEVFMAPGKEVHYFDRHFDKGIDWYRKQFAVVQGEKAIGEATPNYMHSEHSLIRIAATLPDAKLIAILRNPVDRAYSHYWHQRNRGRERLSFADAIAAEPQRLASGSASETAYNDYLERGCYLRRLQHICEFYPRKAIHVVITEDLGDSPINTFQEVCRFLDVDDTLIPVNLGVQFNKYVDSRSKILQRVAWKLRGRKGLGQRIGNQLSLLNTRRSAYPPMDSSLREELARYFEKENAALSNWLGRDLSIWDSQRESVSG